MSDGTVSREGSLDVFMWHSIEWQESDFFDIEKLDEELCWVFDICYGCCCCFNLCDSFLRLFDLIDESESGELDMVDSAAFKFVVDACILCDMCFMTKCLYVPFYEFNLDFSHLMLRYCVVEAKQDGVFWNENQLIQIDRNGCLVGKLSGLANWVSDRDNKLIRLVIEKIAGVHRKVELLKYVLFSKTFLVQVENRLPEVNAEVPAHGREAVLYATCFVNYNKFDMGVYAQ